MLVSLAILVATVVLFVVIPKGFFPDEDTGRIHVTTEAAQDISFDAMREHQLAAMKIVAADPNVDGFISTIGAGGRLLRLEQRPHVFAPERPFAAEIEREPDHPGIAPEIRAIARLECLFAKPAAHPRRRHAEQRRFTNTVCRTPT